MPFADNFLAGSLISLLLPAGLLVVIAIWFARTLKRLPGNPGRSTAPPPTVSEAQHDAVRAHVDTGSGDG